ncbi:predicted protein [Botrytis cinerea T4]|uniref:Uncharacterized protein n=1 Tax=Botryotinia fuckeliana (strain T4) TaxID=999810 RepID=G2YIE1_BOTF4|nr:predicted protein [Botrytis cinerea T4]
MHSASCMSNAAQPPLHINPYIHVMSHFEISLPDQDSYPDPAFFPSSTHISLYPI